MFVLFVIKLPRYRVKRGHAKLVDRVHRGHATFPSPSRVSRTASTIRLIVLGNNEVTKPKSSSDLRFRFEDLVSCHGGNEPTKDKARGTCETCHGFPPAAAGPGCRSSFRVANFQGTLQKPGWHLPVGKAETTKRQAARAARNAKGAGDAKP